MAILLYENERFMRIDNFSVGDSTLVVKRSNQGRNQERDGEFKWRSKSIVKNYKDKECYYCGKR